MHPDDIVGSGKTANLITLALFKVAVAVAVAAVEVVAAEVVVAVAVGAAVNKGPVTARRAVYGR